MKKLLYLTCKISSTSAACSSTDATPYVNEPNGPLPNPGGYATEILAHNNAGCYFPIFNNTQVQEDPTVDNCEITERKAYLDTLGLPSSSPVSTTASNTDADILKFWSPGPDQICGCENYGYWTDGKFCKYETTDYWETLDADGNRDTYGGAGTCVDCSTFTTLTDCDNVASTHGPVGSQAIDDCKDKCHNFKDREFWYFDHINTGDDWTVDRIFAKYEFYIQYSTALGATYWLGGLTPQKFTLYCDPCVNDQVTTAASGFKFDAINPEAHVSRDMRSVKYNTNNGQFDFNNDYMVYTSANWNLKTSQNGADANPNTGIPLTDYTFSFEFKTKEDDTGLMSFSNLDIGGHDRNLYLNNGKLYYRIWPHSTYEVTNSITGKDLDDNQWHTILHTCVSGAPCETYIDGKRGEDSVSCSEFNWAKTIIFGYEYDQKKKLKGKMRNIQFYTTIPLPVFVFAPGSTATISNVATDSIIDKNFIPLTSDSLSVEACDAIYFEFCEDSACLTPLGPSTTPTATAIAAQDFTPNVLRSALTTQSITFDSTSSGLTTFFIKGYNSGQNFAMLEVTLVICGLETVTGGADYEFLNIEKAVIADEPTFTIQASWIAASANSYWFQTSFSTTTSHENCLDSPTYTLCNIGMTSTCTDLWTNTTVAELDSSNNLLIYRNPITTYELYVQAQFPLGGKSAFRKLTLAVCGLETVELTQEVLEFKFEYEVGSSINGAKGSKLWKIFSEEFEQFFTSTDPDNCPIFNYEILGGTEKDPDIPGEILLIPNPLPSQIYVQKQTNGTYQIYLITSASFNAQSFYLRSWTENTFDNYTSNAYGLFDIQMINCTEQWVDILDPDKKLEHMIHVNASTPQNLTVFPKFNSSHTTFCPITSLRITQIFDIKNNDTEMGKEVFDIVKMGDNYDEPDEYNFWQNLILNETGYEITYLIHIEAATGTPRNKNATSDTSDWLLKLIIQNPPNMNPTFEAAPVSMIFLDLNDLDPQSVVTYKFPNVTDFNVFDINWVTTGKLPRFTSFSNSSPGTNELTFRGLTVDNIGIYLIYVQVHDNYGGMTEYEIDVEVALPERFEGFVIPVIEEPAIVVVEEEIEIENAPKLTAEIETITQMANMTIRFSEPVYTGKDISWVKSAISLKLLPDLLPDDFDKNLVSFTWEPVSFVKDRLDIKLQFYSPLYISMNIIQDKMKVEFVKHKLFFSKGYLQPLDKSSRTLFEYVPRQLLDNKTTQNFSSAADKLDQVLQVVFWILLIYNLCASGTSSMEHFIVMINSLQIAIHLPIFNVLLPSNVILFFDKMIPIVMFDIVKDEWKLNPSDYLEFDEENNGLIEAPEFPRQMANIGYDSHNFLQNVGSLQLFVSMYLLRVISLIITKICVLITGKGQDLYMKQYKKVVYTEIIILFIEGYIEFCIAGYLQYGNTNVNTDLSGEKVAVYFGNASIIMALILIPIGFAYMLSRGQEQIESEEFKLKYGGLYEGIKTNSKPALYYFLLFVIRRILFLAIAFYLYQSATLQFQFLYGLNLLSTIYIGLVKPKKYWLMNWIELFNEGVFQAATIHIIIFSDYVPNQEFQYYAGFSMVGTMSVLILVNFGFVAYFGGIDIYLILKKYYRIIRRYFDPQFLPPPPVELSGNLPEVYKPFNALEEIIEQSNDLSSISEEVSNDIQSEFSFKPVRKPYEFEIQEREIAEKQKELKRKLKYEKQQKEWDRIRDKQVREMMRSQAQYIQKIQDQNSLIFGKMKKEFKNLEVKASTWSKYQKDAYLRNNKETHKLRAQVNKANNQFLRKFPTNIPGHSMKPNAKPKMLKKMSIGSKPQNLDDFLRDIETPPIDEHLSPVFGNLDTSYIDDELENEIKKVEKKWKKRDSQKIKTQSTLINIQVPALMNKKSLAERRNQEKHQRDEKYFKEQFKDIDQMLNKGNR